MNDLICNRTWDEIRAMQQKGDAEPVTHANKPTATDDDIALMKKHGISGLREMQFFGVIDRLRTSGYAESNQQAPQLDRETWLTECAQFILDDLIAPHCELPTTPFRVSVGFPSGRPSKVIAQCWKAEASADSTNEIFVTPVISDSIEILASLAHELVHYSDNCQSGHQNHFARVARAIGLEGKLTATVAGPALKEHLQQYVDLLGPIPHAALDASKSGKAKQGTRMIKVECHGCGFTFRTTQKHIDRLTSTAPCPCCAMPNLELA